MILAIGPKSDPDLESCRIPTISSNAERRPPCPSTRAVSVLNRRTNRQLPDWPSLGHNVSFAFVIPTAFGTIYGSLPIVPRCCELSRCSVQLASEWSANREDLRAAHDPLTQVFNAVIRLPPAPFFRSSCDLANSIPLYLDPLRTFERNLTSVRFQKAWTRAK